MTLIKVKSRGTDNVSGRRNLVINGAMNVAQRGTSASVTDGTNEGYSTIDRFRFDYGNNAGGVATISQDSTVPSGYGFSNSFKVDVTTADTSVDATHMIILKTIIEAQDIRNSGWDYTNSSSKITLSFWARSVKAGIYNVTLRANEVGAQYYPIEYTLVANTWKKVEVSIPGDSSLVFDDNNDVGLEIRWNLQLGDDRNNGTANQWNGASGGSEKAGTSNQVNFFDSTDNNFFLTGVQLEVGDSASDFEHRSFGEELALCQRYFEKMHGVSSGGGADGTGGYIVGAGIWYGAGQVLGKLDYKVTKRANPTIALSANNALKAYTQGAARIATDTTPFDQIGVNNARINLSNWNSNGTIGDGTLVQLQSSEFLTIDCDL